MTYDWVCRNSAMIRVISMLWVVVFLLFLFFYFLFIIFYDLVLYFFFFFFQAEDGIRDRTVTGVQTCALPISRVRRSPSTVTISLPATTGVPLAPSRSVSK